MKEKLNKYAIRKLSIGVASVLIGASFFVIANAKIVKADTLNNSAIIQTSKASAAQDTNVPKAKDASVQISNPQTKEELTKTDAQSSAPQTKDIYMQSSASQGTQKNGLEADSKQSNTITPETQESTQTDQTKAVQSQTLDNRQAPNINASDWMGEVVSNTDIDGVTRKYYKLTKYMGSDLDIVVPDNDALTQASTYEVGVTSDFIKDLAKTANSITFLGKNNIKALNSDWNSTFDQAEIKTFNGAGLDTSNITTTAWLFNNNQNLTSVSGVSDWDTSHITNMNGMFSGDTNLSIIDDLSNWNVSNCTNVHTMFFGDANLTNIGDLSNWDTENIQDFSQMFFKTAKLTSIGDLSKWALENDKDLSQMFFGDAGLTNIGDLSNWNTKNVQNMFQLFFGCSGLRDIGKLDNWQTGNTTNMSQMFFGVNSLSNIGDLSKWDTMRVQNMSQMFFGASGLSNLGNLDNWDVSSVQDMSKMFENASGLTNIGNLSKWNTKSVTNMSQMFFGASKLINIGNLNNWNVSNVQDLSQMFFGDSSLANIGDLSTWKTGKVTNLSQMFFGANKLTNIGDLSNWDTSQVQNMSGMFFGASGLTSIGKLNNWNTSKVTNLSKMFEGASKLVDLGDLSNWDTSIVTNMSEMFFNAGALTNIGKLDKWDTSNTTNMAQMFFGAGNLKNLGLANWNTDQVTDMHGMFEGASKLSNLDLSNWKTDKVQNMDTMFNNASSLSNLNISGWVIPDNNSAMLSNQHHLILVANGTTVVPNKTMFNYSYDLIVLTNNANLLKLNTPTNSLYINGDPYTTRSSFYNSNGSSDAITVLKQANNIFAKDYVAKNAGVKSLDYDANLNQTDPFALANAKFVRTDQTQVIPSYSTAKRTITIYNPDGTKLIYVQTIGYVKRDVKDMFTGIVTQDTWNLDDQTSSFTINNIKQVGKSYVDKNNKIYFAKITIPKINGYKAVIARDQNTPTGLNYARYYMVSFVAIPSDSDSNVPSEPAKTPDTNPSDVTHADKPGAVDNKNPQKPNENNKDQDQGNKGQDQGGQKTDDHKGQIPSGNTDNTQKSAEIKPSNNDQKPADNPNADNTKSDKDVNSTDYKFDGKKSGNDLDTKSSSKKSAKTVVNTTKKTALNGNDKGVTNMVTMVSTTGKARDSVAPKGNIANADNGEVAGVRTVQTVTVNSFTNGAKDLPHTGKKQDMIASILGALASGLGILELAGAKYKKKED